MDSENETRTIVIDIPNEAAAFASVLKNVVNGDVKKEIVSEAPKKKRVYKKRVVVVTDAAGASIAAVGAATGEVIPVVEMLQIKEETAAVDSIEANAVDSIEANAVECVPKPDYLARVNAHERDQHIIFDEGPHEYTVRGEKGYTSVTTWNGMLFDSFDSEKAIKTILKNPKWKKDPTYKYYQKTAEEISEMWRTKGANASSAGTKMHFDIECYYNGLEVVNDSVEYAYFLKFAADYAHLEAYRTEWCVFHEEVKLSGSIDMVFRDKNTGEFYIYDWKRSEGIEYESYGNKCSRVPCVSHLPACNFWKYSLQLNTYRFMLEENYGIKIAGMFLVCIHPDHDSYEVIECHDLRNEIADLMDYRRKILAGEESLPSGSVGGY